MRSAKTSKAALAEKLGVSRSSLYYKPKKPPEDEALKAQIDAVMAEHPAYGHRRIAIALEMNKKTRRPRDARLRPQAAYQARRPFHEAGRRREA
jgi:hypothetical protein